MKIRSLPQILSSVSLLFLSTAAMPAAVLVYDGFDYPVGSSLYSQNGGIGWGGAWGSDSDGTITVNAQSSWSGTTGNFVSTTPITESTISRRSFASAITTGTIFVSIYMENLNDGQRFMSLGLYNGSTEATYFGQRGTTSNAVWGIGTQGSTSPSWGLTTPSLLVLRIDFDDADNTADLRLYVDPDLSLGEPGTANVSVTDVTLASFTGISLGSGFTTSGHGVTYAAFDELYVTNSWASLGSIPEPGTVALLFGAFGVLWLLRRSSRQLAS